MSFHLCLIMNNTDLLYTIPAHFITSIDRVSWEGLSHFKPMESINQSRRGGNKKSQVSDNRIKLQI